MQMVGNRQIVDFRVDVGMLMVGNRQIDNASIIYFFHRIVE